MSRSGLEGSRIEEFCSRVYIECMALDVTMRLCPECLRIFCLRQFGEAFAHLCDKILLGIPDVIRAGRKSYDLLQEAQPKHGSVSYPIRQLFN
jgi:hypothetical protein